MQQNQTPVNCAACARTHQTSAGTVDRFVQMLCAPTNTPASLIDSTILLCAGATSCCNTVFCTLPLAKTATTRYHNPKATVSQSTPPTPTHTTGHAQPYTALWCSTCTQEATSQGTLIIPYNHGICVMLATGARAVVHSQLSYTRGSSVHPQVGHPDTTGCHTADHLHTSQLAQALNDCGTSSHFSIKYPQEPQEQEPPTARTAST